MKDKLNSIKRWIHNRKIRIGTLLSSRKLGLPGPIVGFLFADILIYTPLYLLARLVLGRKRAYSLCDIVFRALSPSKIFSLPSLSPDRVEMAHWTDISNYVQIYIEDMYSGQLLQKGMVVFDIGANIGMYTVLAASLVGPQGKVIAIEPEPKNYDQLVRNIELNGFTNVVPLQSALSEHEGKEKLYLHSSSEAHSLFLQEDKDTYIEVPVTTLDSLCEKMKLDNIDVLKIDTEGAELSILEGGRKILRGSPKIQLFIEGSHYPGELQAIGEFLREEGFIKEIYNENIIQAHY